MESFEEDTYALIFSALKHPIRRKILRILKEKRSTYTEILNNLGVGTGFLNYHLEKMSDLISKDSEGRYFLTSFGEAALSLISEVEFNTLNERSRVFNIFGKKINFAHIFSVIIVILIIFNASLIYGYQTISNEKSSTFAETLIRSRSLLIESVNALNSTIGEDRLDIVMMASIHRKMLLLSQNIEFIMSLDFDHRIYWSQIKEAIDSFSELLEDLESNILARIISDEIKDINLINISYSQNLSLGKIKENLSEIQIYAFSDKILMRDSSQLTIDDEIIKAVDISKNMISNIDLARRVFNLGYKFYNPY